MTADLVILAFVAAMAIFGFYKGFIKSVISLLSFLISLVIAILLARVVADALLSSSFIGKFVAGDKSIYSFVYTKLPKALENIKTADIRTATNLADLFNGQSTWFLKLFYPLMKSGLKNEIYLNNLDNARQIMALEVSFGVFTLLVGLILFAAIRVLATAVGIVFKKYTVGKKTLTGRSAGALIGALKAVIYSMIILCVFTFMTSFSFMQPINDKIADSQIAAGLNDLSVKITSNVLESKNDVRYERLVELIGLGEGE